jgi:hypothetical protein
MATTNDGATGSGLLATSAKGALERVCSGEGLDPAAKYYSPGQLGAWRSALTVLRHWRALGSAVATG